MIKMSSKGECEAENLFLFRVKRNIEDKNKQRISAYFYVLIQINWVIIKATLV